jgi:hypothetical protein
MFAQVAENSADSEYTIHDGDKLARLLSIKEQGNLISFEVIKI